MVSGSCATPTAHQRSYGSMATPMWLHPHIFWKEERNGEDCRTTFCDSWKGFSANTDIDSWLSVVSVTRVGKIFDWLNCDRGAWNSSRWMECFGDHLIGGKYIIMGYLGNVPSCQLKMNEVYNKTSVFQAPWYSADDWLKSSLGGRNKKPYWPHMARKVDN